MISFNPLRQYLKTYMSSNLREQTHWRISRVIFKYILKSLNIKVHFPEIVFHTNGRIIWCIPIRLNFRLLAIVLFCQCHTNCCLKFIPLLLRFSCTDYPGFYLENMNFKKEIISISTVHSCLSRPDN